ncbi:MAG: efflux RND transporter permease subunit [Spirochaetales bacterium]|nr:efflux RND transporter permease subunit [Spirochaetales bacterium]
MSLSKTVVNKPTTILIIFALLVGLALYIVPQIPIDLYPEMNPPILVVQSSYNGAGPEEVEQTLTRTLESMLINVSNVKKMTSTSSEGSSMIILQFDWAHDLTEAANEVRDKLEFIKDFLPEDSTTPQVFKFDPSMLPIMDLVVTGNRSPEDLLATAENQIQPYLEQVEGVATSYISGGRKKLIRIEISQNRLEAYELTLTQVSQMLASQNMQIGAGNVAEDNTNYLVRTSGEYSDLDDIRNTVIAYKGGGMGAAGFSMPKTIRLRDIAQVKEGYEDASQMVYINGEPGIYVSIQKQSGTNSVEVADKVKAKLESINTSLPAGVQVSILTDSTNMIRASLGQVVSAARNGAILAMLVLFIFLRNFKSTFIVGLSIPVSLLITLMIMYFMGLTLNISTLGGLTLGIGMIVDSSIVILENIFRYREKGAKAKPSALLGSQEMITAIMASTLTTICVFLPVLMFKKELDVIGVFFKDIALTIVIALLSSLIVSVTLVPVLSSKYLKLFTRKQKPIKFKPLRLIDTGMERLFTGLDNSYKRGLAVILHYPKMTVLISFLLLILSLTYFGTVGMNLFPSSEEESITLNVALPNGTRLDLTREVMDRFEEITKTEVDGYKDIIVTSGTTQFFGLGSAQTNSGSIKVTLDSFEKRTHTSKEIKEIFRSHYDEYPSAEYSFSAGTMDMGGGSPIDIVLKSEDLDKSKAMGEEIIQLIKDNLPDLTEPTLSMDTGLPEVEVIIDREKAYTLGLNVYTIGSEISAAVDGRTATRFRSEGEEYDVLVILAEEDRNEIPDLNKIFIMSALGSRIPVSSFARLEKSTGPVSIAREDQTRVIHVTAGLRPGVAASEGETAVRELLEKNLVPDEQIVIEYAGDYQQVQDMMKKFIAIMLIAVALVFGVMASQFESLLDPFIIFLSIPLMAIGIILIYLIMGSSFSMLTAVGLVMLAGIVVNNGIVLVDYTNLLVRRGFPVREACIEAGGNRLRPILMTSLTTILGMAPMAFMAGEGADMVQPMGLTVVGGLTVSTIMTLFFVPAIYLLFNKGKKKKVKDNTVLPEEEDAPPLVKNTVETGEKE